MRLSVTESYRSYTMYSNHKTSQNHLIYILPEPLDYIMRGPHLNGMFQMEQTPCVDSEIEDDDIYEGNEYFYVSLRNKDIHDSVGVMQPSIYDSSRPTKGVKVLVD